MTVAVTINGTDVSASVMMGSLTVQTQTAEFTLLDLSTNLGANVPVTITDAAYGVNWSGTVNGVVLAPAVNKISGHFTVRVSAIRPASSYIANTSPFDLSDVAGDPYDTLLTEDGVNTLLTEDGVNDIITEGPRNVAYRDLSIGAQLNLDGTVTINGQATVFVGGLGPGQILTIHCADITGNSSITTGSSVLYLLGTVWAAGTGTFTVYSVVANWQGAPPVPVFTVNFGGSIATNTVFTPTDATLTMRNVFGLP